MKIIRFSRGEARPEFGVVCGDRAVAFASLQRASGLSYSALADSRSYLANLPDSEQQPLADVHLHEPVEVAPV
jgi:hypothetical protein